MAELPEHEAPAARRLRPAAAIIIAAAGVIVFVALGVFALWPGRAPEIAAPPTLDPARAALAARILASGPQPWRSPTPSPIASPLAYAMASATLEVVPTSDRAAMLRQTATAAAAPAGTLGFAPTSDRAAMLQQTATAAAAATLQPVPTTSQTTAVRQIRTASPTATATRAQATATPGVPTPVPPCGDPTLVLGSVRFRVQPLARAADGSIAVPPDMPGIAYLVQNTDTHYVFALSPTALNLRLQDSVRVRDQAVITWGDCSTEAYEIQAVETNVPALASLLSQTTGGLTAFVQGSAQGQGLLVRAGWPGAGATPEPGGGAGTQADVLTEDPVFSADGQSLTLGVTITNTGPASFTITSGDVSLILEDDSTVAPTGTQPGLPLTIRPGASATLRSTFPKPLGSSATLKILDLTVPYYF